MRAEVFRRLAEFDDAVLTGSDAEGYPYSVRCLPTPDRSAGLLELDLGPAGAALAPGPASLLCHEHDEGLWNQKAFVVRGRLDRDAEGGWAFVPERFVPGVGIGGMRGMARFLIGARRSAGAYLRKRGLARPRVPWEELGAIKEHADARRAAEGRPEQPERGRRRR